MLVDHELEDDITVMVHSVVHDFPASNSKHAEFKIATGEDSILKSVLQAVWTGKFSLRTASKQYGSLTHDMYEIDGVLFHGSRLVVPEIMQQQMLALLHEGH